MKLTITLKGGKGSGHHGHAGRPGKHGGSLPSGVAMSVRTGRAAVERAAAKKKLVAESKKPTIVTWLPSGPLPDDWEETSGNFHIADMKASDHLSGDLPKHGWKDSMQGWEGLSGDPVVDIKKELVTSVTQRANDVLVDRGLDTVSHEIIGGVVDSWAATSNDDSTRALSLQMAAAKEFGFELSTWQKGLVAKNAKAAVSATDRAILRGMYNNTQNALRESGYKPGDTVKLFRGLAYGEDKPKLRAGTVAYKGNVMDSWTLSDVTASEFAAVHGNGKHGGWSAAIGIEVPMESVLSTARTGFGCMCESEFVIFGNVPGSNVNVFWVEYLD